MEANVMPEDDEDLEEYVLLNLDGVSVHLDIPPNAKYVLTGLDALNPVLIIDDKLKRIGEYEETIGTSIVFKEEDAPMVYEETGPSEVNLFPGTRTIDPKEPPTKQVKPLCQLQKVPTSSSKNKMLESERSAPKSLFVSLFPCKHPHFLQFCGCCGGFDKFPSDVLFPITVSITR
ncbi:hypothetical protein L6164_018467 [Bauhinia variegata]|uniref:Uncharacterized protein n=1 Tax=Bauhinia variegata TaxID=167791 RepID=A0ACB9NCC3_BAUVA|nr:hypothetical protein L6164_018467 [Bauhinia variegata]